MIHPWFLWESSLYYSFLKISSPTSIFCKLSRVRCESLSRVCNLPWFLQESLYINLFWRISDSQSPVDSQFLHAYWSNLLGRGHFRRIIKNDIRGRTDGQTDKLIWVGLGSLRLLQVNTLFTLYYHKNTLFKQSQFPPEVMRHFPPIIFSKNFCSHHFCTTKWKWRAFFKWRVATKLMGFQVKDFCFWTHMGSLPDMLSGRNTYEEPAGGMWGILNELGGTVVFCQICIHSQSLIAHWTHNDLILAAVAHDLCEVCSINDVSRRSKSYHFLG